MHALRATSESSTWVTLLQEKLVAGVHKPTATVEACKAAYEAAIAASNAEKVVAEQRKHAAINHARESAQQRRKAIRQKSKARCAACASNEAEELREAQQAYDNILLSLKTKVEKATQAWEAAQREVGEERTQQEQICSNQEELVKQLMYVLQSAEKTQKV